MTSSHPPLPRGHARTPVDIDVMVNGVLNFVHGRITDLSEAGAVVEGAIMPEKTRCEIHFAGEVVHAVVIWSEFGRMGVRFPYELTHSALYRELERARGMTPMPHPSQIFRSGARSMGFGRRGLS